MTHPARRVGLDSAILRFCAPCASSFDIRIHSARDMPPLKIAVATRCLSLPLKDSLRVAASLGAKGVQFDAREELRPGDLTETGRRQLLHGLGELGLSVASLAFPM